MRKNERAKYGQKMDAMIAAYRERLGLQRARFVYIEHEDAMVAAVFKVTLESGKSLILKICSRPGDYFREAYFLSHFSRRLPVPRIVQLVPPEAHLDGAILMEFLEGNLLKEENLTEKLSHEIGTLLARIHMERAEGYGDVTDPEYLSADPRLPFTAKFEEGMEECKEHLPAPLLQKARHYYDQHIDLLITADGPCIVHRDFRPGNLIMDQGKIQGVIDWSSARGGFAEEDLCLLESGEWPTGSPFKTSFLSGYASIRKVPDYHRILPLLRLSKAIATIGFTVKRGTWQAKGAKIYQLHREYLEKLLLP